MLSMAPDYDHLTVIQKVRAAAGRVCAAAVLPLYRSSGGERTPQDPAVFCQELSASQRTALGPRP